MKNDEILENINKSIYDFVFNVTSKQFKNYKKTNFKGTYIVNWGKGKITKEII